MTALIVLTLLEHIALCVLLALLCFGGIIRLYAASFVMAALVPVFGPLTGLVLGVGKRLKKDGSAEIFVDRLKTETEIYRSMGMPVDDNKELVALEDAMVLNDGATRRSLMLDLMQEHVVPLEEALSVSPSDVRRRLMMDILTTDTSAFYALLEEARLNDDVEVVHYATTAMTELNKQYDVSLQKYGDLYRENPKNEDNLARYCDCLEQYLALGLVKGQIERTRREDLIACLQALVKKNPSLDRYGELAKQLLLTENFADADETLCEMERRWPEAESTWMLRIEYYVRRKDGDMLQRTLRSASVNGVYFSNKAREQLRFWLGDRKNGSAKEA